MTKRKRNPYQLTDEEKLAVVDLYAQFQTTSQVVDQVMKWKPHAATGDTEKDRKNVRDAIRTCNPQIVCLFVSDCTDGKTRRVPCRKERDPRRCRLRYRTGVSRGALRHQIRLFIGYGERSPPNCFRSQRDVRVDGRDGNHRQTRHLPSRSVWRKIRPTSKTQNRRNAVICILRNPP